MTVNKYIEDFKTAYENKQKELQSLADYKDATEQEIKEDAYYYFGSGKDISDLGESKALDLYIGRLLLEADGDVKKAFEEYTEDLSHDNIEDCYSGEKAVYSHFMNILDSLENEKETER